MEETMSNQDQDNLTRQMDAVMETIEEYARQIETGVYGRRQFDISELDESGVYVDHLMTVFADDEDDAYTAYRDQSGGIYLPCSLVDITECADNEFDEPTIVDDDGNETPISEWPLEVEVRIGRPLSVLLSFGGPNIYIEAQAGQTPRLVGAWGVGPVYRSGDAVRSVFDYFIDPIYDFAPEEWK